jgi:translation initiation factor 2B subunit (eIF-2B alpha/beta/delta family)
MGRFRQFMSSWKAGDFFRQLATVVIGIIITFGGSGLIQRAAERKEAKHLLEMVKSEMEGNAKQARGQKEWFEYEKNGAKAIRPYIDDPEALPIDTLIKYINIQSSHLYPANSNAFSMLKSSSSIQSIKDKRFLLDLFSAYDAMAACNSNAKSYTENKSKTWQNYFDSVERDMVETVFEMTDPIELLAHVAASPQITQYLIKTANSGWLDNLIEEHDSLATQIDSMIEKIEKEIE